LFLKNGSGVTGTWHAARGGRPLERSGVGGRLLEIVLQLAGLPQPSTSAVEGPHCRLAPRVGRGGRQPANVPFFEDRRWKLAGVRSDAGVGFRCGYGCTDNG